MGKPKHFFIALLAAASIAALATDASALGGRDAAVAKCLQTARAEFPGTDPDPQLDRNRTSAYKACMARAGFPA
ncbi:MAG: hypothetical protein WD207_06265 [Xanthobacteraceae bacterium]